MRAGWTSALEQLVRRADMSARIIVEARLETAADIRQRYDQWQQLDVVRLRATANNGPVNSTVTAFARSHLDPGSQPFFDPITNASTVTEFAALIEWNGSESPQVELGQVQAWLNPQFDLSIAKTVAYWQLELYHIDQFALDGTAVMRSLLAAPMRVSADGQAAGFVTWDFTALASRPRPKQFRTASGKPGPGFQNGIAHTLVVISGRLKDGTAASNIGWGYDGGHNAVVSGAGSTVYGAAGD